MFIDLTLGNTFVIVIRFNGGEDGEKEISYEKMDDFIDSSNPGRMQ